jgi:ActR/RegA family two-component response regulator
MKEETILIVEDSDQQRNALQIEFELRGFSVRGAKNVAEARETIKELGEKLAVMVIDMRLEDADAPAATGADLGLEVLEGEPKRLPEFLILSAYSLLDYYKLAVRLGAAAYLSKEETDTDQLVRHVRALLIRRNLSIENPDVARRITHIAEDSRSLSEAVAMFCSEVISPAFSALLGAPHALLINYGCPAPILITDSEMSQELQHLFKRADAIEIIHERVNSDEPFIFSRKVLYEITVENGITTELKNEILGTAFLTVPFGSEIKLSIGILPANRPLAENPEKLAGTLRQYLGRSLLEPLLYMLEQCLITKERREAFKSQALLVAHTSSYIAEEQIAILSDAVNHEDIRADSESFRQLMSLAEALRDTGQTLMTLEGEGGKPEPEIKSLRRLILDALKDVDATVLKDRDIVQGDCQAMVAGDDLFIAVSCVLRWFAQRLEEYPASEFHVICEETRVGASVTFEDSSPQLPLRLRQRLFSPFAQPIPIAKGGAEGVGSHFPLYLAKALIELKHGGKLEDRSDELPYNISHRFVIQFPTSPLSDK